MLPTARVIESAQSPTYSVESSKGIRSVAAELGSRAAVRGGTRQKKCLHRVRQQRHLSLREACSSLEVGTNSLEPQGQSSRMGQSPTGYNAPTLVSDQVFIKKSRKLGKNNSKNSPVS